MSLLVQKINERQDWEKFIATRPEANFLQSYTWGEFHQSLGKEILPLALINQSNDLGESSYQQSSLAPNIIGAALGVVESARRGKYLAIAGGPLLNWSSAQEVETMFAAIKQAAKDMGCTFIRFRPQLQDDSNVRLQVSQLGAKTAPMHLTADRTIELDLTLSDDQILSQMRKNTRYSVKKAQSLGITTRISQDQSEIADFYNQQLYLASKHGFVPFSLKFLQQQFAAFVRYDQVALIHSYYQNSLLASAFVIFYNQEAAYHYGVSTPANGQLPGSYATQWAAIQEAKRRGCVRYNLWGVAPEGEKHHRFAGVSLFKRGFGGREVIYLPAQDIPLSPAYLLTNAFEKIRAATRRL